MKEFEYNNLNNFIAGWYIDPMLCDDIVNKAENTPQLFSPGDRPYTNVDLHQLDQSLFERYINEMQSVVENYKKLYPLCSERTYDWRMTFPRVQRYEPGKYYNELHCENDGAPEYRSRHLVYMTYLNDIEEGGGTEFVSQNIVSPAKKGLTLVWPSTWTHHHRGVVANHNIKYIITGWFNFV